MKNTKLQSTQTVSTPPTSFVYEEVGTEATAIQRTNSNEKKDRRFQGAGGLGNTLMRSLLMLFLLADAIVIGLLANHYLF